ncbi:hypothetical protein NQ317_006972 [Molorchus minor]|uniref:Uncharacterized protein n=1 Tax=Molorchus minor TaxID=1323400 RepID=A0ABQ9JNS4_9CUCU|nr:hypothetical protein NQ317_006972 [Molorchus minor]
MAKRTSGEPVLTDYVKKTDSLVTSTPNKSYVNRNYGVINTGLGDNKKDSSLLKSFMRPSWEKTESDIVLKHSEARRSIRESLEARRREVESQFAKEAENMRRRSSRPIEINSLNLSNSLNTTTGSNSTAGDEFSFIQILDFIIFNVNQNVQIPQHVSNSTMSMKIDVRLAAALLPSFDSPQEEVQWGQVR